MVVKKNEKKTGGAKIASDRRLAQLLFAQMCPQPGEPMMNRLWSGNRTSPGGRTLLEMTQPGPETQIYAKEICPKTLRGASITILQRINLCCA